jgi:hypothetical protein
VWLIISEASNLVANKQFPTMPLYFMCQAPELPLCMLKKKGFGAATLEVYYHAGLGIFYLILHNAKELIEESGFKERNK